MKTKQNESYIAPAEWGRRQKVITGKELSKQTVMRLLKSELIDNVKKYTRTCYLIHVDAKRIPGKRGPKAC